MNSKEIIDILELLNSTQTYKKVFINGKWGIGKSYYTNEFRKKHLKNTIYISLFGKNSFDLIESAIARELMGKLNKKQKLIKNIKKMSKCFDGVSVLGLNISTPEFERKTMISSFSNALNNSKLVVIIDDLERKSESLQIEDILGMIEELSLYENILIVIIGDETKIEGMDFDKWSRFKEKVIEKEYNISAFSMDAIESLVFSKLKRYICREELEKFYSNFLAVHNISNLRTIKKGINLFDEVVTTCLNSNERYCEISYIAILENCMAVSIELTEELYKPNDQVVSKEGESEFELSFDKNDDTRIIKNYFGSPFLVHKETYLLADIMKIYRGEYSEEIKNNINIVLREIIEVEEEKNIFYFNEDEIESKIRSLYEIVKNKKYHFLTEKKFMEDFESLFKWNQVLDLQLDKELISSRAQDILMEYKYDNDTEDYCIYESGVSEKTLELKEIIRNYNEKAVVKYYKEKIDQIVNDYSSKNYNLKLLNWLDQRFIQTDGRDVKDYFMRCSRENNYFIPDLSGDINDDEWAWTHRVWKLYFLKLDEEDKIEMNDYAEVLKKGNKLTNFRINSLQEYRPLVGNVEKKT